MLLHTCWCIGVSVLSGFDLNLNWIKVLWKLIWKLVFRIVKRRKKCSLSSVPSTWRPASSVGLCFLYCAADQSSPRGLVRSRAHVPAASSPSPNCARVGLPGDGNSTAGSDSPRICCNSCKLASYKIHGAHAASVFTYEAAALALPAAVNALVRGEPKPPQPFPSFAAPLPTPTRRRAPCWGDEAPRALCFSLSLSVCSQLAAERLQELSVGPAEQLAISASSSIGLKP
jgi:hypothetical protein